jgi:hypothetical protein
VGAAEFGERLVLLVVEAGDFVRGGDAAGEEEGEGGGDGQPAARLSPLPKKMEDGRWKMADAARSELRTLSIES